LKKHISGYLFLILLTFFPSGLLARPVDLAEAEKAAQTWVSRDNPQKNARLTPADFTLGTVTPLTYQGAVVGYAASLSPQGFIILPAATELSPIQFISYESFYESIKDHPFLLIIQERLSANLQKLGYLPSPDLLLGQGIGSRDQQQVDQNERAWGNLAQDRSLSQTISSSLMAPLLTSKWSQDSPYNLKTPGPGLYPTGCVATALAQVMYYWKYPSSGQGTHSYEWVYGGTTLSADFNHPYNWAQMIDDYSLGASTEQQDAVAQLMADVGRAIDMQYTPTASAAHLSNNAALVTFFKYSPFYTPIFRRDFGTTAEWFETFKAQLNSRLVVPMAVYPFTHAIVIDGYRTDNYLNLVHVNIGWGGLYDGYYTLDTIYGGNYQGGSGSPEDYALINVFPQGFQPSGPSVSGILTGYDQLPVKCEKVEFWKENSSGVFSKTIEAQTGADGRYFTLLTPGNYKVYFNSNSANYHPDCKTLGSDGAYRQFNDEWYNGHPTLISHPELSVDMAEVIQVTTTSRHTIDAALKRYCPSMMYVPPTYFTHNSNVGTFFWDHIHRAYDGTYFNYCDRFQIQRATHLDFRDAVEVYRGMPLPYYNTSGTPPGQYYFRIRAESDACGVSPWLYSILVEIQQQISNIYLPLIIRN
jgi:hypothetical protein